jgi:G:T/U-mismatch repair DNA glycosylase
MKKIHYHPFEPFINDKSRTLIIGRFPATEDENKSFYFYYSNSTNLFWTIIEEFSEKTLEHHSGWQAVEERKKLLDTCNIAITDIVESYEQTEDKENITELRDIFSLLKKYPKIGKIITTSGETFELLKQHLRLRGEIDIKSDNNGLKEETIQFDKRNIKLYGAYSADIRTVNIYSEGTIKEMYKKALKD